MQSTETEDRWYVDVGGTPKMMTLDELVEAFENGVITANSLVTEVGGTEWKPLKEVADLGDEEETAPPPSLPTPPISQRVTTAPVSAFPPVSVNRESAWPPAAAWSQPPVRPSAAPVSNIGPNSTVPVVQDLSIGLDDMPFQRKRSKLPLLAAAAVVLLGGAGFAAMKSGSFAPAASPAPAAQPITFQKTVTTPLPTSEPAAAPAPAAEKSEAKPAGLSEETKAALLSADKDREAKKKSRVKTRGAVRSRGKSGSNEVFRAGGSADDPLNSKL